MWEFKWKGYKMTCGLKNIQSMWSHFVVPNGHNSESHYVKPKYDIFYFSHYLYYRRHLVTSLRCYCDRCFVTSPQVTLQKKSTLWFCMTIIWGHYCKLTIVLSRVIKWQQNNEVTLWFQFALWFRITISKCHAP